MMVLGALLSNAIVAGALFRTTNTGSKVAHIDVIEKVASREGPVEAEMQYEDLEHGDKLNKNNHQLIVVQPAQPPVNNEHQLARRETESEVIENCQETRSSDFKEKLSLLKDFRFLLYCLNVMTMPFCIQTVFLFFPGFTEERGIGKLDTAFLLSVMGLSDMAGRFIFGFVFDLPAIRRNRRLLHSCSGIVFGVATCSVGLMNTYSWIVCLLVAWGLAGTVYYYMIIVSIINHIHIIIILTTLLTTTKYDLHVL